MINKEVVATHITPEIPLLPIKELRPTFEKARIAIEKLVQLARLQPPSSTSGDWGEWNYNWVHGNGMLYVSFGKEGIATVSLFEWVHEVIRSRFMGGLASWIGRPNQSHEFRFALISELVTGRERVTPEQEPTARGFMFYQEIGNGNLQLEQLGSIEGGWYEPKMTMPHDAIAQIGTMKNPAILDRTFYSNLQRKRQIGISHLD